VAGRSNPDILATASALLAVDSWAPSPDFVAIADVEAGSVPKELLNLPNRPPDTAFLQLFLEAGALALTDTFENVGRAFKLKSDAQEKPITTRRKKRPNGISDYLIPRIQNVNGNRDELEAELESIFPHKHIVATLNRLSAGDNLSAKNILELAARLAIDVADAEYVAMLWQKSLGHNSILTPEEWKLPTKEAMALIEERLESVIPAKAGIQSLAKTLGTGRTIATESARNVIFGITDIPRVSNDALEKTCEEWPGDVAKEVREWSSFWERFAKRHGLKTKPKVKGGHGSDYVSDIAYAKMAGWDALRLGKWLESKLGKNLSKRHIAIMFWVIFDRQVLEGKISTPRVRPVISKVIKAIDFEGSNGVLKRLAKYYEGLAKDLRAEHAIRPRTAKSAQASDAWSKHKDLDRIFKEHRGHNLIEALTIAGYMLEAEIVSHIVIGINENPRMPTDKIEITGEKPVSIIGAINRVAELCLKHGHDLKEEHESTTEGRAKNKLGDRFRELLEELKEEGAKVRQVMKRINRDPELKKLIGSRRKTLAKLFRIRVKTMREGDKTKPSDIFHSEFESTGMDKGNFYHWWHTFGDWATQLGLQKR